MGVGGVLAAVHDVLITLALASMLNLEINASFIAVILTIIGYSINDTVIVFDRIRENLRTFGESAPLSQLCNLSISQTILRTLNTIVSVVFMIIALLMFGGDEPPRLHAGDADRHRLRRLQLDLHRDAADAGSAAGQTKPLLAGATASGRSCDGSQPYRSRTRDDCDQQGSVRKRVERKQKAAKKQRRR